jgi:hypothetical protein
MQVKEENQEVSFAGAKREEEREGKNTKGAGPCLLQI